MTDRMLEKGIAVKLLSSLIDKGCRPLYGEIYGCGIGIVGGSIGGWGIEGITDRVVRNRSKWRLVNSGP
jgi:hypothetical protein